MAADPSSRWELYRLLSEPVRARILALVAQHELAVGELAEILDVPQPKISRHAAALREAGLVAARHNGPWTLLRTSPAATADAVVADALAAGRRSCEADGTLGRLERVLADRDAATREFFARSGRSARVGPPLELGAYLSPFAELLPHRALAVDVGTGDGALLEVLAPVFERVVAVDREQAQVELAAQRLERRGLGNVELVVDEVGGAELSAAVARASRGRGADLVFASRVLHHARVPADALASLVELARAPEGGERGGAVVVLDYETHDDVGMRDREADLWLGFDPAHLVGLASAAGLGRVKVRRLPDAWRGAGPDRHLPWTSLVGFRTTTAAARAGNSTPLAGAPAAARKHDGKTKKKANRGTS